MEGLRNMGWIITQEVEDIRPEWVFNCSVKVKQMDTTHHGIAQVVDLRLSNCLDDVADSRLPQLTGEELRFDCTSFRQKVEKGEVYMLIGAKIFLDMQSERCLGFPATTENTASILLPSREDSVASVVEMFCGGMGAWAEACRLLPAECVLRIDHERMAISSTLLNQKDTILFSREGEQEVFNTFWGEVIDLRWTTALHKTNTEFICASPPCGAYAATGNAPGLQDSKATVAWLQMVLVMRFLQRRALLVEALPGFAQHEDFETIRSLLKWAGYRVIWHGVLNPTGLQPVEQPRFFMIAWNSADNPSVGMPFRMLHLSDRPPMQCEPVLWKHMPAMVLSTVRLIGTELTKVTTRELLPRYFQQNVGSPIHIRLINPGKPLPILLGNYRLNLDLPWVILKKRGLFIPLLYHGADIRALSKWEILRAYGFHMDYILPDNEKDALALLNQCLLPCQALTVLVSALGHRHEQKMGRDEMMRYLDAALTEWGEQWEPFDDLIPFDKNGWSKLIKRGDLAQMGPQGYLTTRLVGLQIEIDSLTYGRQQGRVTPFLPETSRTLYEEMGDQPDNSKTWRLFQAEHGYHSIVLDDEDTVGEVNRKVAEFIQVPQENVAIAKLTEPTEQTLHWILAGEVPQESYGKVLVLVDPAAPAAWWLNSEIDISDLKYTYADHQSTPPDLITVNDKEVLAWPVCIQSGDHIRLRWNHSAGAQAWRELDVFKVFDESPVEPPASPTDEGGESIPGGPTMDPHDGDSDAPDDNGSPATPPDSNPVAPHEMLGSAETTLVDPTQPYEVEASDRLRGMPFQDVDFSAKRQCTREDRDLQSIRDNALPATINYEDIHKNPKADTAFYILFQHQLCCFNHRDKRTLEEVVQDEWGLPPHSFYFTRGVKVLGPRTTCDQIPVGSTVIVRGRLRGGTGNAVQKLKHMLQSKGVPEDQLEARIQEVRSQIGEKGIKEVYTSFDPWSQLKARCTTRLVREAEAKHKPRAKSVQEEAVDPLQIADPWTQALKERGAWKLENSFFQMEDGSHPVTLEKLAHGACGLALIGEKEAEILMQSQETMSDNELAALVVGSTFQSSTNFKVKNVETPCRNKDNTRILVRAQLINFGKKTIGLAEESNIVTVEEVDATVVSCEMVKAEMEEWDEMVEGTTRFLKTKIQAMERGFIGSWGRKFFQRSKQVMDASQAETCYLMLRIKRECLETILKQIRAGIYFSPRKEDGTLDPGFKVIWTPDKPLQELMVKASSEASAFGLVKNKTGYGLRVKSTEFLQLRQKWQPSWTPIEDTPYNIKVQLYYDIQNLPISCTKTEVQKFVNKIGWKALVLRQLRPRTWTVGAETAPDKLVHLTSHGTVLISEQKPKGGYKGKSGGKGKHSKGALPWWVAGASATPTTLMGNTGHASFSSMITDAEQTDLEERLQKKMDDFHKQQVESHKMLRQDFQDFQKVVTQKQDEQDLINQNLSHSVQGLTASLSKELGQHMQNLTMTLESQKADFATKLTNSQISLKEELMGEMRTQLGAVRKRCVLIHLDRHLDGCNFVSSNNYRLDPYANREGLVDEGSRAGDRDYPAIYFNSFYHSWNTFFQGDILLPLPTYMGWRVGEAANPGPDFFTISGTNTQSLNSFCDDGRLVSEHAHVLVYTETAATVYVQQKATKLAHGARKHTSFSKPVKQRAFQDGRQCATKGEAKGAAIISALPTRPAFAPWSQEAWDSSRVSDTFVLTQRGPVLVIAIYGLHQGLPDSEEHNEALLREASWRANQVRCPALIVGDLNCDLEKLNAWQLMVDAGWSDAAVLQAQMDGEPPQKTYKDVSRLDYVLMNDIARSAFRSFFVSMQAEMDHKTVNAVFDWSCIPKTCTTYRMPMEASDLPLTDADFHSAFVPPRKLAALDEALATKDIEKAWNLFCEAYEEGDDDTVQLRQRIRQIRRLEAYIQQMKSMDRLELTEERRRKIHEASSHTWLAICNAPGFNGPFREWWFQNHAEWFPQGPPNVGMAQVLRDHLVQDEKHWRTLHRSKRDAKFRSVFTQDWKKGGTKHYKAIRPPGMPRVDSLNVVSDHRVVARRARQKGMQICTLEDDELHLIKIGSQWKQDGATAMVSNIKNGKIFLQTIKGCMVTGTVSQHRPSAHPAEILKAAEDYWYKYWNLGGEVNNDDEMVKNAVHSLPTLPNMDLCFDAKDLQWVLSTWDFGQTAFAEPGVPEGCPIAVVQMIILTWCFTNLVETNQQVPLYSYVDDWMLITDDLASLTSSVIQVKNLADKLGLILSISKSSLFATSTKLLNQVTGSLSHHHLLVGTSKNLRGLGTNFQTAKVASIDIRTKRWTSAKGLLDRLQYMPWTAPRKTQIVCRCILPHIFFGIENTYAGKDFIREVRAKCNHTVGGKLQYHLHYLAPLFSGDRYEPVLYIAERRFGTFLRSATRNLPLVKDVWKKAFQRGCFFKRKTRGCVSIFQNQLHELGWALDENGRCTTPSNKVFNIWDITTKQFKDSILESWEIDLLRHLHEKQNLDDLASLSIKRSIFPEHKDPMIQGFMRKVRLGGLFPNKRLKHFKDDQEDTCIFCGQLDTMKHRVYHCPGTEHVRQGAQWDAVKLVPTSLLLGGLFPKLEHLDSYWQLLDDVQPPDLFFEDNQNIAHIFTDGSALEYSLGGTRQSSVLNFMQFWTYGKFFTIAELTIGMQLRMT
ncbi:unnamed protein product [Symbiodinium sp. CCMP2592]|nr:unnamed protein product [Symbiodinium sp. CCMP2592]